MRLHLTTDRVAVAAAVVVVGLAACAGSARAATPTATANVVAGTLSLMTSAAPSVATALNGTDIDLDYTLPLSVLDARGSGVGWNVTVTSTRFTTGGATPRTLPNGTSKIRSLASACAGGTCTLPAHTFGFYYPPPIGVPAGATPPTPTKFFNATADTGMGDFTVTPTIRVTVPANAYTGVYTSTVTVAVVSGP